jgi:Flp pilus assembly protein TadD
MKKIHVNSLGLSQQQLNNLLELYQAGRYEDAEKLSLSITQEFPEHPFAWKVLGAALKQMGKLNESLVALQKSAELDPLDAEVHYNLGIILKDLGKLDEAETSFRQAITLKPNYAEAYNNLSNTLKAQGRLEEAEVSYKKAITLKPDLAEAHNNLGNTLEQQGRLGEAEASYRQAIALKPDFIEAHNNLGNTLKELGRLDEAEAHLRQAIKLKPDYEKAHNNLGVMLQELGRLDEAEISLRQAIILKPDYTDAQLNLVYLLAAYSFQKKTTQPIIKADQEIKKIDLKGKASEIITDDKIVRLFSKSSTIIERYNLKLKTKLNQIYRRDTVNLNCNRHFGVFNKSNIIPEFCFGCFKVQVEPRSVLELIKLFVVFDQIKLTKNNIRKCMIEMRPKISGFYKGIVYCSSIEEAYQIADYLETIIKNNIRPGLPALVKRGCSEYSFPYPDFKKINRSGVKLMNYNKNWKLFEEDYDSKNPIKTKKIVNPSLSGLNLMDVIIIRNWIDYAKGIGDQSVELLNQQTVSSQEIYSIAKKRLVTFPWQGLV